MKLIKKSVFIVITAAFAFSMMAFVLPQDDQKKGGPWDIPAEYKKMTNPYADDASLLRVGKMLYSKHCKSCHGNKGLGDGPKADKQDTHPGDFSSAEFHAMSDGDMFYKSIIGRDDMPNYESKIPDVEDRWAVINYMRATFKK
ncbi:MAG: cytochrome c [Bacteroidales bacterium]|nr:cytochrome c [Bacteroidales bacterium]